MTTVTQSPANCGFRITPLRAYLLGTALLLLVITSPFTVGPGFAHTGMVLSGLFDSTKAWAARNPLSSWFVTAAIGFSLFSGALAVPDKKKGGARGLVIALTALGFILGVAAQQWFFWTSPTIVTLFDAFAAAGGVPTWLNFIATALVVILANIPHIAVVIFVMVMVGTAAEEDCA
ncbi:hypothetical protein [Burkholderia ambifaria]|uniref:hypothetical protein n=1 Tax=Burkholderia ambifaria TaxID=152480 RepID=UPI000F810241|nr:hypothetical protein [Burkholderia ambifaria]